jgi:pyrroline-5-carboxylate reductase
MSSNKLNLVLIGCGKMGSSLLSGWEDNPNLKISVVTQTPAKHKLNYPNFEFYTNIADVSLSEPTVIVIAVKPNIIETVLKDLKPIASKHIIVSVASFVTLDYYKKSLGLSTRLVRAMPNMAASHHKSATALIYNNLKDKEEILINSLFSYIGTIYHFHNEDDFNKFTAICGCGPAYFFYFIECLIKGTESLGFDKEKSLNLVYDMILGSAELLKSDKSPQDLRLSITSKGGITERALHELMEKSDSFENIVKKTISAAYEKSCEFSK